MSSRPERYLENDNFSFTQMAAVTLLALLHGSLGLLSFALRGLAAASATPKQSLEESNLNVASVFR